MNIVIVNVWDGGVGGGGGGGVGGGGGGGDGGGGPRYYSEWKNSCSETSCNTV